MGEGASADILGGSLVLKLWEEGSGRLNNKYEGWGYSLHLTAGLPILWTHTNNQFSKQLEGLRHFRDHGWKVLGEENSELLRLFLFRQYFESYIE